MGKPIKVYIIDDHELVRSGLRLALSNSEDFEILGDFDSGDRALADLPLHNPQQQPDVVVLDLDMPMLDGVETTELLLKQIPDVKVVILSNYCTEDHVVNALKAGALSYLVKTARGQEIAQAVRAAYEGKPTLSPEAVQILLQATRGQTERLHNLTPRERKILRMMTQGMTNQQIAAELDIAQSTAKFHVGNILTKLNVNSRTEAVAYALQNNLV
ncbi:MAG: response regulator transcription factor [Anaerolineae bacterium]|nr:response regulator transcription factor [Anaerolineae bacterium]MDW8171143.1 response regulator transcription factor [Anaerolineae bacterium]